MLSVEPNWENICSLLSYATTLGGGFGIYSTGSRIRLLSTVWELVKSESEHFKCRIIFEIDGVSEEIAREALYKASAKLPIKTKFVKR